MSIMFFVNLVGTMSFIVWRLMMMASMIPSTYVKLLALFENTHVLDTPAVAAVAVPKEHLHPPISIKHGDTDPILSNIAPA